MDKPDVVTGPLEPEDQPTGDTEELQAAGFELQSAVRDFLAVQARTLHGAEINPLGLVLEHMLQTIKLEAICEELVAVGAMSDLGATRRIAQRMRNRTADLGKLQIAKAVSNDMHNGGKKR